MSYKVLALKYRPQNFQDVIGQEHVTKTLSNAITSNRVAHAILLTGPRGTGKTTIARIMAKAMNCEQGPTPVPCNVCKSCKSITNGNSADVFEIDGASNNSVDQIRELRANVTYMPTSARLKIYIIDEVHMLSTAAFNALLKTLEEPPDHVMFIFATTESHKIPITILSRCQRHDLGRLKLTQISEHLHKLCCQENFIISRESTDLIASEADGSMRDSLSLLDRILSSSQTKEINHDSIINNLGIMDKKVIFDISSAILSHNLVDVLNIIDKVHDLGLDLKKFYTSIIKHFRNIAVIKACNKNTSVADITDSDRDTIFNMVSNLSVIYLTQILNIFLKEEQLIKSASHTRTALEMVILKIIQVRPALEIDEVIKKLDYLAGKIGEGSENIHTKFSNTQGDIVSSRKLNEQSITEAPSNLESKTKIVEEQHALYRQNIQSQEQVTPFSSKQANDERGKKNLSENENNSLQQGNISSQSIYKQEARLKKEAMSHPIVTHAVKIFSGNIIDVKISGSSN